jgi:hypothetical protein
MTVATKCLAFLVVISLVDMVIPVPILGMVLIYVVFSKPVWFREMVEELYGRDA